MNVDERALAARVKVQLRKRMVQLRGALPRSAARARSERIVQSVLEMPAWRAAKSVALFCPITDKSEVDVSPLDAAARSAGKRVAYPFMRPSADGFSTGFAWTHATTTLANLGRGFPEPPWDAPVVAGDELDFILVAALAVAPSGHRLGFGRGWYDATLDEFRQHAVLVVVAFEFQLLVELPVEEHDVACNYVVTDERVIAAQDP